MSDRKAKFVQTLVFYDEPQLVLLKSEKDTDIIGLAVPDHANMESPFFACEVRPRTFERYLEGKSDLNYLFRDALRGRYFMFDLAGDSEDVTLYDALDQDINNPDYWPLPRAFSRAHTSSYRVRTTIGLVAKKKYRIDGNWDTSDLAHFNRKMSNLYAVMVILNRFDKHGADDERTYMQEAIRKRFWAGGGSYVGFYDELFTHVKSANPLDVERIEYSSPGVIELKGDSDAFSDIDRILEQFEENQRDLQKEHDRLHGILQTTGLLRPRGRERFSDPRVAVSVRNDTLAFADSMKIVKANEIYITCERNAAVFCKVILSIFRRANELHLFHAEGRIEDSQFIREAAD